MPEVPVEELPKPLREVKEKYPEAKIHETTPESHGLKGKLHYMEHSAVVLLELGKLLWPGGKKFRVTIECDPETEQFEARREDII